MNLLFPCNYLITDWFRIFFQANYKASLLAGVVLLLLSVGVVKPVQASSCPNNGKKGSLTLKVESIFGEQLDLGEYDGIQAVILTNRHTRSESESLSKSLALEFGQNSRLRQIVLVDGRGLILFRDLVLQFIRESTPKDSRLTSEHVYVSVDFEGKTVEALQALILEALPGTNLHQQAALLILNGQGIPVSGFTNLEQSNLKIRQCIRTLI